MFRKILPLVMSLALPGLLAAQREIPNSHASDTAKAKVAEHRATQVRGSVENADVTPATRAVPATRATPATPASRGNPPTPPKPPTPATPAVPASPSKKPTSAGQSGNHRP